MQISMRLFTTLIFFYLPLVWSQIAQQVESWADSLVIWCSNPSLGYLVVGSVVI